MDIQEMIYLEDEYNRNIIDDGVLDIQIDDITPYLAHKTSKLINSNSEYNNTNSNIIDGNENYIVMGAALSSSSNTSSMAEALNGNCDFGQFSIWVYDIANKTTSQIHYTHLNSASGYSMPSYSGYDLGFVFYPFYVDMDNECIYFLTCDYKGIFSNPTLISQMRINNVLKYDMHTKTYTLISSTVKYTNGQVSFGSSGNSKSASFVGLIKYSKKNKKFFTGSFTYSWYSSSPYVGIQNEFTLNIDFDDPTYYTVSSAGSRRVSVTNLNELDRYYWTNIIEVGTQNVLSFILKSNRMGAITYRLGMNNRLKIINKDDDDDYLILLKENNAAKYNYFTKTFTIMESRYIPMFTPRYTQGNLSLLYIKYYNILIYYIPAYVGTSYVSHCFCVIIDLNSNKATIERERFIYYLESLLNPDTRTVSGSELAGLSNIAFLKQNKLSIWRTGPFTDNSNTYSCLKGHIEASIVDAGKKIKGKI